MLYPIELLGRGGLADDGEVLRTGGMLTASARFVMPSRRTQNRPRLCRKTTRMHSGVT